MAEYTLKYINHRAECDAEAFVNDCEEHYHRQLHLVADQIAANLFFSKASSIES